MAIRQNLAKATTSPERGVGRPLRIVVATLKSRHPRGPMTTEIHPHDMATMGGDNSLGTIVATMDSSVIAPPIKIVQIIQTTGIRIKIETSLVIILITKIDNTITIVCLTQILTSNNSMSNSNFNFQNDQGYNSRGSQNYEGFNQDSSYSSQNNDWDVEESSSPSSPSDLQLQIASQRMIEHPIMIGLS